MQPRDAASLVDLLEAAKLLQSFLEGVDGDAFETDLLRQSAVTRQKRGHRRGGQTTFERIQGAPP